MYASNPMMHPRMIERLRELYKREPAAKRFFDWAASRTNDAAQTSIERVAWKADLDRRGAIEFARLLEDLGCGEFVVGRRGGRSRIVWHLSLKSIGQAAAGASEKLEPVDPDLKEETSDADGTPAVAGAEAALTVPLSPRAKSAMIEAAASRDEHGAATLAREILESWVEKQATERRGHSIARAAEYLREHKGDWSDDPASFFPAAKE